MAQPFKMNLPFNIHVCEPEKMDGYCQDILLARDEDSKWRRSPKDQWLRMLHVIKLRNLKSSWTLNVVLLERKPNVFRSSNRTQWFSQPTIVTTIGFKGDFISWDKFHFPCDYFKYWGQCPFSVWGRNNFILGSCYFVSWCRVWIAFALLGSFCYCY